VLLSIWLGREGKRNPMCWCGKERDGQAAIGWTAVCVLQFNCRFCDPQAYTGIAIWQWITYTMHHPRIQVSCSTSSMIFVVVAACYVYVFPCVSDSCSKTVRQEMIG
jgi:hypothetical protein